VGNAKSFSTFSDKWVSDHGCEMGGDAGLGNTRPGVMMGWKLLNAQFFPLDILGNETAILQCDLHRRFLIVTPRVVRERALFLSWSLEQRTL
jgi:hypothetical protein